MSFLRASVWVEGTSCRTVGDVRKFVAFCDQIGLSDEARVDDDLMVDLKVAGVEVLPDRPASLVVSLQP